MDKRTYFDDAEERLRKEVIRFRKQPTVTVVSEAPAAEVLNLVLGICEQLTQAQTLTLIKLIDRSQADVDFTKGLLKFAMGDMLYEFASEPDLSNLVSNQDFEFSEFLPAGLSSAQLLNVREAINRSLDASITKAQRREAKLAARMAKGRKSAAKASPKKSKTSKSRDSHDLP
jgi:hypothetical protein